MTLRDDGAGKVAVLEWSAWEGFLLTHVLGDDSVRLAIDPFKELPGEQFEYIRTSCRTVCFQINLSVRRRLPLGIRNLTEGFIEHGIYVVNGFVQDIRKSALHAHLELIGLSSLRAKPTGDPDEVLFIKTDLNYGGDLERWLPTESIEAGGLQHLVAANFGAYHYKAVKRALVEESLWTNPAIVIERYITNAEGSFYRVYFSGERIIIVHAFSAAVIKKLSNDDRDTNYVTDLTHLKDETDGLEVSQRLKHDVATFIENSPIEFGCIDIVHDGNDNYYIVDLNLTPWAGKTVLDSFLTGFLREGIRSASQRQLSEFIKTPLSSS